MDCFVQKYLKTNEEKRGTCIYVCLCVCVSLQQCSVLLSSSAAIYLTPPSEVHPTERQYSGETCTAPICFAKGKLDVKQTHGCVDFLKIEVVHSILFTINLIFKHYFRPYGGPNESFTFLYSEIYCSIFLGIIKQHCFSF